MNAQLSVFDQPRSRETDPSTSAEAALVMAATNGELENLIRAVVDRIGPSSQEEIAAEIQRDQPDRWTTGSIVSACSRAYLDKWGEGHNRRGRRVILWVCADIPPLTVQVAGGEL